MPCGGAAFSKSRPFRAENIDGGSHHVNRDGPEQEAQDHAGGHRNPESGADGLEPSRRRHAFARRGEKQDVANPKTERSADAEFGANHRRPQQSARPTRRTALAFHQCMVQRSALVQAVISSFPYERFVSGYERRRPWLTARSPSRETRRSESAR
jgi:hypothetical protein